MKTAKILIVGNEILSGRTTDTNSQFIARALHARGIRLLNIDVLPDEVLEIAQWIHQNQGLADFIFVAGGIGGTPDDVTRLGVAKGLGLRLQRHPVAEKLLKDYYQGKENAERMAMADLPEGCELISNSVSAAPGFRIGNIFVFAGIPKILYAMFEEIKNSLWQGPIFEESLRLKVGEGEIARFMKEVNREFPLVELGSYPTMDPQAAYKTELIFTSETERDLNDAVTKFKTLLQAQNISWK